MKPFDWSHGAPALPLWCAVVGPRVPGRHLIGGFIVTHAHRVDEDSAEAFILRLFREKNRDGFIKPGAPSLPSAPSVPQ